MKLRHRRMLPKDVRKCAEIVAAHPLVGPRYGNTIALLSLAWLRVLGGEAFQGFVFEETGGSRTEILGVAVSVFVSGDFLRDLKTPPFFWIGQDLVRRITRGESPLLSDRDVQNANVSAGLDVVVWEACFKSEVENRPEMINKVIATFMEEHRGFLLNEWISHMPTADSLKASINAGCLLISDADGRYVDCVEHDAQKIVAAPHLLGLTRELAVQRLGFWTSSLFVHRTPELGFRPSEQRMLDLAAHGGTDEELAGQLGISLSAVKKSWGSIYDRVAECVPELSFKATDRGSRGKEKKQRLLAYLREHPEELRPTSRRLLRQQLPRIDSG